MAENKTKPSTVSVSSFIESLGDPLRIAGAFALLDLMQTASGEEPKMWGTSIIGFGSYHYKYESGREGDMPLIGFSPRKAAFVLYGMNISGGSANLLPKLGKHTTGKGCVYIKKLADIDRNVLQVIISNALAGARIR